MAQIQRFDAKAPRLGNIDVPADDGSAAMLSQLAQSSAALANRLGAWADKRKVQEQTELGFAAQQSLEMPGVEFAYDGKSAATTVGGMTRGMRGDVRKIVSDAAQRYGVDPNALLNIAMIESSGNPAAKNPRSSAGGLFQFIDSTAAQYGLRDRFDPAQAADAAARLTRDNAAHLRKVLGRDPTGAELYLAHQQGAGGAAKLLKNPNAPAASVVGENAVKLNGGRADMTAGEFAGLWLKKAGGSQAAPAGAIKVSLTGQAGPLRLKPAGTLGADAYNKAATDAYLNRLDTAMRAQMDAVAIEHEGDPAGLTEALDAMRAGYVRDLPPQAAALLDQSFQAQKLSLTRQAVTKFNDNLDSQAQATLEENISARTASIYRLAANGGTDEAANGAIAAELGALDQQIDGSRLTPLQKSRYKADVAEKVMSARVLGGFEGQRDPDARAAYAQKFQEDWRAGKLDQIDLPAYDRINGELMRAVQADQVKAGKQATAIDGAIKGQISVLKKGWPVTDQNRTTLKNQVAATGDPALAANLDFLDGLSNWQRAHIAARPEVIDAQIAAMQARIQKEGATEAALTTLDVMEGLRDQMDKGLREDPLTWANRAGVLAVEPLDFANGSTLSASLSERVADARAVAQHYGIQPKFFTPAEADGLKKTLKSTPLALPSLASSLVAGFGDALPQAMGEISKDAPVLAQVANLVDATGSQKQAVEVASVLEQRALPGYKSPLPPDAKLQGAAQEMLGPALANAPGMAGALGAASALLESRAIERNLDLQHFDEAGNAARVLYQDALDEAMGATWRNGVKFGGIADVNGSVTIAPPDIEADALEDMVSNISASDLIFQDSIGSANGIPITPAQLQSARLVMTAQPGRYRLALGDIEGGEPRFVQNAAGGAFELDVGMLKRTQAQRALRPPAPAARSTRGNFR